MLSTTEPKNKEQTKQTSRTGTDMEIIWRVIVAGRGKGENGGKGAGIKYKLVGTEETGGC